MFTTCRYCLVAILVTLSAGAALAKGANRATYAQIIARSCQIRTGDVSQRFFARSINLDQKDIRIRNVQKGWKGWVRVHAVCRVDGGAIWGFIDINLRSGKAICDARNWEVRMSGETTVR